jgi:transposase
MDRVPARRRRHSAELKARILDACAETGASVARIALENGLNANVVHKWRRHAAGNQRSAKDQKHLVPAAEFVPLAVLPAAAAMPTGDIRISIRRGGTTVDIEWPVSGAESCAQWLRELLR